MRTGTSAIARRPVHLRQAATVNEPPENAVAVGEHFAVARQPGVFLNCPPPVLATRRALRVDGVDHDLDATPAPAAAVVSDTCDDRGPQGVFTWRPIDLPPLITARNGLIWVNPPP